MERVVVDPAVGSQVLGEAQRDLRLPGGERRRTLMRVNDKQVNGVGADVEHSQAHGCTLLAHLAACGGGPADAR